MKLRLDAPKHGSYGRSAHVSWGDAGGHANFWAMFVREHDAHPVNGWRYGLGIELGQSEEVFFIQQPLEGWCTQEDVFGAASTKEGSLPTNFVNDSHLLTFTSSPFFKAGTLKGLPLILK